MNRSFLAVSVVAFSGVAVVIACGEDTATPTNGASSSSGSSSGRSSTSSGTGSSGTTSSSGTSTSGSSSGSSSGGTNDAGTDAEAGPTADHLVISEVGVAPPGGEFIEIYNPTAQAVDLTQYYLSDNALYRGVTTGAFAPTLATSNTDFLARFPSGTMLAAGAVITVATNAAYETQFGKCPNFILKGADLTCTVGTAKAMLAPTDGGIGTVAGLSNDREMLILFKWDGVATTVKDVDYVTWGTTFDSETRVDKTGLAGYVADTDAAAQKPAAAPPSAQSIERCSKSEQGEKGTGGNGIGGHDETSEPFSTTFKLQQTPTPGVKNTCL